MKINKLYLLASFTFCSLSAGDDFFYQNGKKVYINPLNTVNSYSINVSSIGSDVRYFTTQDNDILGLDDEILLKSSVDITLIIKKYNLTLLKKITSTIYLVQVINKNMILDISNRLYEDKDIEFAHPNFRKKVEKR